MKDIISMCFVFLYLPVISCDICGNYMGISMHDSKSQLAIMHRYRVLNGYVNYQQRSSFIVPGAYKTAHDPQYHSTTDSTSFTRTYQTKDFESFKVLELRGRFKLGKRFQLNAFVPVVQNKTKYNGVKNTVQGISDISLALAYHVFEKSADTRIDRTSLGAGIKLPTGRSDLKDENGLRFFLYNQPGTGSWDPIFYINHFSKFKYFGFNFNSLYKICGTNQYGERCGHSAVQSLNVFAQLNTKNIYFFPGFSSTYEYCKGLYVFEKLMNGSNTNVLLGGPSVDINYKRLNFHSAFQFNCYERVASNELTNAGRWIIMMAYNF